MKQKLKNLFEKQNELNNIIDSNWIENRDEDAFFNAFMVEAGELLDHVGYKWWKKQEPNIPQARMEVVDLWFFYLSDIIKNGCQDLKIYEDSFTDEHFNSPRWDDDVEHYMIESIVSTTGYMVKNYSILGTFQILVDLTNQVGMSLDALYDMYIGKLMLNIFRQENGYKTGTYIKNWGLGDQSVEDNEVLMEILKETSDPAEINLKLTSYYVNVVSQYFKQC